MMDNPNLQVDQAPQQGLFICAAYTPYGISMLDSRFCHAIKTASTLDDCRHIARKIRENPHLHPDIKENLMLNLVNYIKAIQEGRGPDVHACGPKCYVALPAGEFLSERKRKICERRHIEDL
jgi:hypothetical protein